jgi:hypothetical protein
MKQFFIALLLLAIGFVAGWFARPRCSEIVSYRSDTIFIRDTIREIMPTIKERLIVRTDVDTLRLPGDTVFIAVEVPIEKRSYASADYYAEISGYKPSLDLIKVFPQTKVINTVQTLTVPDSRRWGVGVNVGAAYSPYFNKFTPSISVGVQYNLFEFGKSKK